MDIELVLAISEARLGDGLEASRPGEPLRNGHIDILAAGRARNKPERQSEEENIAYYEEEMSGTERL